VDNACFSDDDCDAGTGGNLRNWQGYAQMGVPKNLWWTDRSQYRALDIHEFVHVVQSYQRKPVFSDWTSENPGWFNEGHAVLLDKLGSSNSFAFYNSQRNWVITRLPADETLKDFSAANIMRFYDALAPGKYDPAMRKYVYTLGFSTIEALVAIAGVDSAMELITQNQLERHLFKHSKVFMALSGRQLRQSSPKLFPSNTWLNPDKRTKPPKVKR
jgi:hypothetical protein